MSPSPARNVPASIRQRLLNLGHQNGEDVGLILGRYAMERLLYRLSVSPYADRFVLKGALLFALWTGHMHRPTRDLDLLGYGDNSPDILAALFREVCAEPVEADGLQFDPVTIEVTEVREEQEYAGHRIHLLAMLGNARIQLHVDIGIGDIVVPPPTEVEYPVLLPGSPMPHLRVYPREAVIAEKLHAMVALGMANSRMKDFYDLWVMARQFEFNGPALTRAIMATFERRNTPIPAHVPTALTGDFAGDPAKQAQWKAFVKRSAPAAAQLQLVDVITSLQDFLLPLLAAPSESHFVWHWPAGGPWV